MTPTTARRRPECRAINLTRLEVRAAAEGSDSAGTIIGYAAVYGSISEDLGGWREMLMPGAFTDVLATNPDVRMPFLDHEGLPVGRTTAGTLRLSEDKTGLALEVDVPDTERGRELILAVQRGDVNQCSFRFIILPEDREWVYPDDELPLRQVNRIDELWDVCLVTFPAYSATTAGVRSLDSEPPEPIPADPRELAHVDLRRRRLRLDRR
jgi:Escherichia/Staphylococcus phage prohead protease